MIRWLKEYKVMIFSSLLTIVVGLIVCYFCFSKHSLSILKYENDNYFFQYDNSWSLKEKEEMSVTLENDSSSIFIQMILLDDIYQYKSLEEMKSQILRDLGKQNKDYHLLAEQFLKISKNYYEGYKILYEKENTQALVIVMKEREKLIFVCYEANSDYFDILIDSVEAILENFTIKEKIDSIDSELNIATSQIPWEENDLSLSSGSDYEMANENYLLKYNIPSNFQATSLDSSHATYRYLGLDGKKEITMRMSIYNTNIYSYLTRGDFKSVYNVYQENPNSNLKEYLEKSSCSGYNCYIYQVNYQSLDDVKTQSIVLIYEIHKNHILVVTIDARNIVIPRSLIDSIKIESIRNYAIYTNTKELEKAWQFDLKIFTDTNYNNIETITLNLPKKWEEIASSKGSNIYQTREFGLDYLKDLDYHQYSIVYSYSRNYYDDFDKGLSSKVEIVNNSISTYSKYGKHEKVIFRRKINLHKKTFYYYSGGYTDVSGKYVEIHLLYVKTNSGILEVKIYGNDVKVSESLFEEITDFDIKLEE